MKIFITGITGTLGQRVAELCVNAGHEVIGLSRCEYKSKNLMNKIKTRIFIGDIRDEDRLFDIFNKEKNIDLIFHFAALKHVDLCEDEIDECIKTNLQGTRNIKAIQDYFKIEKIIFTSTDKAVYPINTYGHCKAISEKIILSNPNNVVCRYGNVLNSRGSVFKIFRDQIINHNKVYITDMEMTRFFISIEDAAKFVFSFIGDSVGIKIPLLKMRACKISDLALAVICYIKRSNVLSPEVQIVETGIRPGEKIHEDMTEKFNSLDFPRFTDQELNELV